MTPTPDRPAGEALKACPFCGKVPKLDNIFRGECVRIYCVGENCTSHPSVRKYGNGDALERAIAAWNARTLPPSALDDEVAALVERLECFEMSDALGSGDFSLMREAVALLTRLKDSSK